MTPAVASLALDATMKTLADLSPASLPAALREAERLGRVAIQGGASADLCHLAAALSYRVALDPDVSEVEGAFFTREALALLERAVAAGDERAAAVLAEFGKVIPNLRDEADAMLAAGNC